MIGCTTPRLSSATEDDSPITASRTCGIARRRCSPPAICYDNEFPEVPRGLALAGASILALPVNWPLVTRPPQEHPPETIQAMAAARSSRLPIVIADRHGDERGVPWTGGSAIIDAHGWIAGECAEGITIADVELFPNDKAIGPHNDVFADRRTEIY